MAADIGIAQSESSTNSRRPRPNRGYNYTTVSSGNPPQEGGELRSSEENRVFSGSNPINTTRSTAAVVSKTQTLVA